MKKRVAYIIFFIVVFSTIFNSKATNAFEKNKNILVFNSYHIGDEWEDSINNGIVKQIKELDMKVYLYQEYMDTKRFSKTFDEEKYFEFCKSKYYNFKIDTIIATDNHAFEFLKKYHNKLFPNVPIVFCGVNNFQEDTIKNERLFTCVTEDIDINSNIERAKKFHPLAKDFYFVINKFKKNTKSELSIPFYESVYKDIKFHYIDSEDFDNLIKQIKKIPKNSVLFLASSYKNDKGEYISKTDAAEVIDKIANVPIYSFWSFYLHHGIVGGVLTDGELQGLSAVNLLAEIQNGTIPSNLKLVRNNLFKEIYDDNKIKQYHIDKSLIPNNAIILTDNPTVYILPKIIIWIVFYVIILALVITILMMHKNISKTKLVEKELKEREEQLLTLINSLPDIICFKDEKGRWIEINNAAVNAFSLKNTVCLNKTNDEIIEQRPDLTELLTLDKATDNLKWSEGDVIVKQRKLSTKGLDNVYSYTKVPVFHPDGTKKGLVIIGRDITEQKAAEEAQKKLDKALEYDKLKTEFFANISHEFRTPLNVLFTTTQLFELYLKNESIVDNGINMPKKIHILKQNCFRLLRLVNNLIDITKIDSGYLVLKLANKNIVSIIEDITLSVAEYIEAKEIEIIFDTEVEEKLMAIDEDKIERILLNLLSNSIKFTPPGGSILVNLYDKEESIIISVKDTGLGISKENQDIIFERFRQVDKSLTRANEGSGIGLSLVKSLVEMHNGTISVRSEYGKGSEFIVELPVKLLEDEEIEEVSKEHDYIERINIEFSDIYS